MLDKVQDVMYCGVDLKKIINANPTIDGVVMETLREFIRDRYLIHLKKDVYDLPKPWTDNPVFLNVKFTNVRREHDRNTKWLIDNVCTNDDLDLKSKILNCILFRMYNKWETCKLIGMPFNFFSVPYAEVSERLHTMADNDPDYVFFTPAFNTGGLKAAINRYLKSELDLSGDIFIPERPMVMISHLDEQNIHGRILCAESPKDVCDILMSYKGIGEFLSYQMFVDFTYIPEYRFSENHFTIAGPGCKLGLEHLFTDFDGLTHEEALFWLRDNWYKVKGDLEVGELMEDLPMHDRVMNVMSLENCFCELGKYIKCKQQITDGKKPRARVSYDGGAEESSTPSLF